MLLHELKTLSALKPALWFVSPVRLQPLFLALRTFPAASFWRNDGVGWWGGILQLWEACCFCAWKLPWPVNTERPLSQPWKCRGGVQCKLMETFMKANKDKAWQGTGCTAFFNFLLLFFTVWSRAFRWLYEPDSVSVTEDTQSEKYSGHLFIHAQRQF